MDEMPRYKLITAHYIDDDLIDEGEIIDYAGVPSENMEPMNEPARERLIEFIGSLQDGKRTPDLGDIIYQGMLNRPKNAPAITDPELIAAVEAIRKVKEAKALSPEQREKSYTLPEARRDVPQTGADARLLATKKKTAVRHGQAPEPSGPAVRKITGNSRITA